MDKQVQLICLDATLVITSTEKAPSPGRVGCLSAAPGAEEEGADESEMQRAARRLELIPTLLRLFFYEDACDGPERFLSYVESQHEISIVFDEQLLAHFADGALEFESIRWKALQVASAGTGAFLSQLAVLTELTSKLARRDISVFQISTYQSDYVLVKVEDLPEAVRCLQSFCMIQTESGEELAAEGEADNNVAPNSPKSDDTGDLTEDEAVAVHQHVLSIPNIDLHLVQMNRSAVKRHMFALVQLLFCHGRRSTNDPLAEPDKADQHFLSYSETAEGVSVVTSDADFLEQAKVLASRGDEGVSVSPDDWKVVQIGATKLGFTETGIVAGQTRVLVNAGTMVFYISTYATDFMLIKDDEWDAALPILRSHFDVIEGHFAALEQ